MCMWSYRFLRCTWPQNYYLISEKRREKKGSKIASINLSTTIHHMLWEANFQSRILIVTLQQLKPPTIIS